MFDPNEIDTESFPLLAEFFTCSYCKKIPKVPMQCCICNRVYCKDCNANNKIPHLCKESEFKVNEKMVSLIEKLKLKCKNGCGEKIPQSQIEEHYTMKCPCINYKEEFCSLLQRDVLLISEYASLLNDINTLKLNKKNWTLEKYKHFLQLARTHKRSKLTTNDITSLQNNLTTLNYPLNSHFESNPPTFFIPRPPNTFIGIPPVPMNRPQVPMTGIPPISPVPLMPPIPPMPMNNLVNNNDRNRNNNNSQAFNRPNTRCFRFSVGQVIIN